MSSLQLKHYPQHKGNCKNAELSHLDRLRIIENAAEGKQGSVCVNCGVAPEDFNAHLFVKCRRCADHGDVEILYCSEDCQRLHYPTHVVPCKQNFRSFLNIDKRLGSLSDRLRSGAKLDEASVLGVEDVE